MLFRKFKLSLKWIVFFIKTQTENEVQNITASANEISIMRAGSSIVNVNLKIMITAGVRVSVTFQENKRECKAV